MVKKPQILVPVLILLVMVLSLGIFTFDLGFYLDDWPNIFFQQVKGPEATQLFHAYDGRPLQGWYPIFLFNSFGTAAWAWQIFAFAIRYLIVVFTWLIFRKVWPKHELLLGLVSILFAVYPVFAQQPIAVTFVVHWTSFLCVMISIYLMLRAVEHPGLYLPFTVLAVMLSGLGLILIEYFVGLELIRPVLLWFMFSRLPIPRLKRLARVIAHFIPYLVVVVGYMVWRLFFIQLPVPDRNSLVILDQLASAPLQTILHLIQVVIHNFITMQFAGWYQTLQPELFLMEGAIEMVSIGLSLVIGLLVFVGFSRFSDLDRPAAEDTGPSGYPLLLAGFVIFLFGAAPAWLIGRQIGPADGLWSDRFGMASMPGVALILGVMIWKIAAAPKTRILLLAALIGLASGWQIRNSNDYRWSWEYQKRVFNQFIWRMPYIQPDTLILSTYEYFGKMGHYPTAFAINTIYPQSRSTDQLDYWYSPLPRFFGGQWEVFLEGTEFEGGHWQAYFKGHTRNAILADFRKELGRCVWVLGPEDALHPEIDEITREALYNSDLSRISPSPAPGYPRWEVVPAISPTWCYYFQKASLARQFENWDEVVRLWNESADYRSQMNATIELVPFIEGLLRQGDVEQAAELTQRVKVTVVAAEPYLCKTWTGALSMPDLQAEQRLVADQTMESLGCEPVLPTQP